MKSPVKTCIFKESTAATTQRQTTELATTDLSPTTNYVLLMYEIPLGFIKPDRK